jgi:hypothetical protein
MEEISVLLLLTSLICMIIGVIRPRTFEKLLKEKANRKTIMFLSFGLMVISLILLSNTDGTKSKNAVNSQSGSTVPQTKQDSIRKYINEAIGEENNAGKQSIVDINMLPAVNHDAVQIKFNSSSNITNNLTRQTIVSDMSKIYISLYNSPLKWERLVLCAYLPLVDSYGNESDGLVFKTELKIDEANKINWAADESLLQMRILPNVWTTHFLHPSLKE